MAAEWKPRAVDYEARLKALSVGMQTVNQHPLLPQSNTQLKIRPSSMPPRPPDKDDGGSGAISSDSVGEQKFNEDDPLGVTWSSAADDLSDPLGALVVETRGFVDPLAAVVEKSTDEGSSGLSIEETNAMKAAVAKSRDEAYLKQQAIGIRKDELNIPWEFKKKQILSDYSVSGSILMNKDAYDPFEGTGIEDGTQTRHLDKYAERLAALERRQMNDQKIEITQGQFEAHVKKLSSNLDTAWGNDERVASLKIAITLAKLLSDTNYPQFYPVMFVMVTDVLERFGDMVYNRLKGKAEDFLNEGNTGKKRIRLPDDFKADDVPSVAKETCRNWFYKVACAKELLPRLLIETTLLRSYRFLTDGDYSQILARMASLSRGLGDPIVSLYAKAYLVVKGKQVAPQLTHHATSMLLDTLFAFKTLRDTHHQIELVRCGIDEARYIHLMVPGVDWVTKCVGLGATKEDFQTILHQYREHCNDAMVLKHIIASFDGALYLQGGAGALAMVQLIRNSVESSTIATDVFAELGQQLSIYPPPEELLLPVLNEVWRVVSKCPPEKIDSYVKCASAWLEVVHQHYSEKELFVLLADLTSHLDEALRIGEAGVGESNRGASFTGTRGPPVGGADDTTPSQLLQESEALSEDVMRNLESTLTALVSRKSDYTGSILTCEHTLRILDVFKGRRKVGLCMDILDSFNKTQSSTGDAVLINTMFDVGRALHDSVDHMSADGDRRQISLLISSFIDKIDFGRDLEQQLSTYVECRGIFANLDLVQDKLVSCVVRLSLRTHLYVRGKHTKKTSAFAKACLAYCHITIASISDVARKLFLLLQSAQAAMVNFCLPQTDTFLKAAISLVPELPPFVTLPGEGSKRFHSEHLLAEFVRNLLSTLVMVPGHPDHGPFYIVAGLLNALPKFKWQEGGSSTVKTAVYIDMLALLTTYSQKKFPYGMPLLESNDVLYCGAPGYSFELNQQIQVVLQEIMSQLTTLGATSGQGNQGEPTVANKLSQARMVLSLANQLATRMELASDSADFLKKLMDLAFKCHAHFTRADHAHWVATVDFIKVQTAEAKLPAEHPLMVRLKQGEYTV